MRWVVSVLFVVSVAACNKEEGKAGDKSDKGDKSAEKKGGGGDSKDPWVAVVRGDEVANKLAEKVGDDFAKADPWAGGKSPTNLANKVDVSTIEKPVAEKVALMSFSGGNSGGELPGFRVTYNPSRNPAHEQYRKAFVENHVFENVAQGLNNTVKIPTSVNINTVDCNTINAFYDPNNKRIIVCYELLDYFIGVFKPTAKSDAELGNAVLGATIFSFFHESGHGLIDLLDLPAVGREEDSVDQLATLILISSGDEGVAMALSGAHWFQLQTKGGHTTPFWDEHAFDGQRFYNILCLIYGSDPKKYGGFVSSGNLPEERAARCPEEYAKINKAWEKLLQPHLTNGAANNINYKPQVPVAEAPSQSQADPWNNSNSGKAGNSGGGGLGSIAGDTASDTPEPAPAPAPSAPAAPAAPKPKPAAANITCEQVARKAAKLIGQEAAKRAESMSEEEVEDLKAKLETQLPAALQQVLDECAKQNWSQKSRACVIKARTLAQATQCK
jgi:hypothetical protein